MYAVLCLVFLASSILLFPKQKEKQTKICEKKKKKTEKDK